VFEDQIVNRAIENSDLLTLTHTCPVESDGLCRKFRFGVIPPVVVAIVAAILASCIAVIETTSVFAQEETIEFYPLEPNPDAEPQPSGADPAPLDSLPKPLATVDESPRPLDPEPSPLGVEPKPLDVAPKLLNPGLKATDVEPNPIDLNSKGVFKLGAEPKAASLSSQKAPSVSDRLWGGVRALKERQLVTDSELSKARNAVVLRAEKQHVLSMDELIDLYNLSRVSFDPRLAGICYEMILGIEDPSTMMKLPNFGLPYTSIVEEPLRNFDQQFAREQYKEAITSITTAIARFYRNPLVITTVSLSQITSRLDNLRAEVDASDLKSCDALFARLNKRITALARLWEFEGAKRKREEALMKEETAEGFSRF
jgi:hypothetical protein